MVFNVYAERYFYRQSWSTSNGESAMVAWLCSGSVLSSEKGRTAHTCSNMNDSEILLSGRSQTWEAHCAWFHLFEVQEQTTLWPELEKSEQCLPELDLGRTVTVNGGGDPREGAKRNVLCLHSGAGCIGYTFVTVHWTVHLIDVSLHVRNLSRFI